MIPVPAVKEEAEKNQHGHKGPPLGFIGKEPEDDKAQVRPDHGPAGTGCFPADRTGRMPGTVDECPPEKGGHEFPEEVEGKDGENGVEKTVE